jgi:hypothetical protein
MLPGYPQYRGMWPAIWTMGACSLLFLLLTGTYLACTQATSGAPDTARRPTGWCAASSAHMRLLHKVG